jgi:F-type H+-transporting ATPase subunit delta
MRQTKVAQRYAKALFDLALETGKVAEVMSDLDTITNVNHSELNTFFLSPVITGDKKNSVFDAVFASHIQPLTSSFFKLVLVNPLNVSNSFLFLISRYSSNIFKGRFAPR